MRTFFIFAGTWLVCGFTFWRFLVWATGLGRDDEQAQFDRRFAEIVEREWSR